MARNRFCKALFCSAPLFAWRVALWQKSAPRKMWRTIPEEPCGTAAGAKRRRKDETMLQNAGYT